MAFDRIKMPDIRKYFKKNKSGRPKFKLNSIFNLRFVLILVIIAAIMIPLCLGGIVIAKSYAKKAMEDIIIEVKGQGNLLAADIASSSYVNTLNSQIVDAELDQMTYTYSARILIVNDNGIIVKDTYDYETGKIIISEQILSALKGNVSDKYDTRTGVADISLPIYNEDNDASIIGVINITMTYGKVVDMTTYIKGIIVTIILVAAMIAIVCAFLVSNVIVRPLGKLSGSIDFVTDGAKARQIEEKSFYEYRKIACSVNRMLDKIKVVDDSREEFVANVSHELKTPMASMRVLAEALLSMDDAPVETYREFMDDIVSEIDRENEIINDLLTLVKADRADAELNISTVNVNELVEHVLKRLNPIAESKDVELIMESFRPFAAEIDEVKMTLAITNIIENAIKYNRTNGSVRVSVNADHKYFYITVTDTGIGIPKEYIDRVFDRFYRVDKARSRETDGTGLGLSITRSIIIMHKGSIKLYSKENEGTTFTIRVPLNHGQTGGDLL